MEKLTDTHIRQSLKNWAASQKPPENGRGRLLRLAAAASGADYLTYDKTPDRRVPVDAVRNRLPMFQTTGSFYQPLLWVMHLNMTPLKNIT